jgi:hypothetical protein
MSRTWDIPTLRSFNDGKPLSIQPQGLGRRLKPKTGVARAQDGVEELVLGEDVDKIGLPGYLENLYAMPFGRTHHFQ